MEIADYLRVVKRHLLVLIVIPVLAGGLAAAYVLTTPRPYTATVYVWEPSLMGSQSGTYQGAQGVDQFVEDFTASATSPGVANAVAGETNASAQEIQDNIAVEQVNLSSQVQLTYTTTKAAEAGPVATAIARQSLTNMFTPQVHLAKAGVQAATKSLHKANTALADFSKKNGSLPVDQKYATLTSQITNLKQQKAIDESQGLTWSAGVLADKIAKKEAAAKKLAPLAGKHQDLLAQQTAAQNTLVTSQQVLSQAKAQLAAADPAQVINASPTEIVPLARQLVTTVLPAAAAGLFLAIGLVAVLELVARLRTESEEETETEPEPVPARLVRESSTERRPSMLPVREG